MVSVLLDAFDDLHRNIQLRVLCTLQLSVESEDALRATTHVRGIEYLRDFRAHHSSSIIQRCPEQMRHMRLPVEVIDERFLGNLVEIHIL